MLFSDYFINDRFTFIFLSLSSACQRLCRATGEVTGGFMLLGLGGFDFVDVFCVCLRLGGVLFSFGFVFVLSYFP